MKVKVNLESTSGTVLNFESVKSFCHFCNDKIFISQLEPQCPFCHKTLRNGTCQCPSFSEKYEKFLSSFRRQNLLLRVCGTDVMTSAFLIADNIEIQCCDDKKLPSNLFDLGTNVSYKGFLATAPTIQVSLGDFEKKRLTFFLRQLGSAKVYICRIKDFELPVAPMKIEIYYYKKEAKPTFSPTTRFSRKTVLGRYMESSKKVVVCTLDYDDFLKTLLK